MARLIVSASIVALLSVSAYALDTANNFGKDIFTIDKLVGQKGQLDRKENVYKIILPRTDLDILVNGMQVTPEMGLTTKITFKKSEGRTLVNGELILLQDQINPVMSVALENNLNVISLHNPFLWDSPRVLLMHVTGEGNEFKLAKAIGVVLKAIQRTMNGNGDFPIVNPDFITTTLNPQSINTILGAKVQLKNGIYRVEFAPKPSSSTDEKSSVMSNSWAAFSGTDKEAVVDGNITVKESELQKVLVALRKAQFYVLSIYKHPMNVDDADVMIIHYWGIGDTKTLSKTLKNVVVLAQTETNTITAPIAGRFAMNIPIVQSETCRYTKILTKEMYPVFEYVQHRNSDESISPTSYMALLASQLTSALFALQENTIGYAEKTTAGFVYALLSGANVGYKTVEKTASDHLPNKEVSTHTEVITHDISEGYSETLMKKLEAALNISSNKTFNRSNPFLQNILHVQEKNYQYAEKLSSAFPVIFVNTPIPSVEHTNAQLGYVNAEYLLIKLSSALHVESHLVMQDFTHALLAAQEKVYNYAEKLAEWMPVKFDSVVVEEAKPVISAHSPGYTNALVISRMLANVMHLEYKSNMNNFIQAIVVSKTFNYDYVDRMIKSHPIVFDSQVLAEAKPVANVVISKPLVQPQTGSTNVTYVLKQIASALHMKSHVDINDFTQALVDAQNKQYRYRDDLIRPLLFTLPPAPISTNVANTTAPVYTPGYVNATVMMRELASAFHIEHSVEAGDFAHNVVSADNKNYDYLGKLTQTKLILMSTASIESMQAKTLTVNTQADIKRDGSTNATLIEKVVVDRVHFDDHNQIKAYLPVGLISQVNYVQNKNADNLANTMIATPSISMGNHLIDTIKDTARMLTTAHDKSFKNNEVLSKAFVAALTIDAKMLSNEKPQNEFVSKLILAQNKDYNYVEQITKNMPVTFPEEGTTKNVEKLAKIKIIDVSFNNTALLENKIDTVLHSHTAESHEANTNAFLYQMIQSQHKHYDYAETTARQHPVIFSVNQEKKVELSERKDNKPAKLLTNELPLIFRHTIISSTKEQPALPLIIKTAKTVSTQPLIFKQIVNKSLVEKPFIFKQLAIKAVVAPKSKMQLAENKTTIIFKNQSKELPLVLRTVSMMPLKQVTVTHAQPKPMIKPVVTAMHKASIIFKSSSDGLPFVLKTAALTSKVVIKHSTLNPVTIAHVTHQEKLKIPENASVFTLPLKLKKITVISRHIQKTRPVKQIAVLQRPLYDDIAKPKTKALPNVIPVVQHPVVQAKLKTKLFTKPHSVAMAQPKAKMMLAIDDVSQPATALPVFSTSHAANKSLSQKPMKALSKTIVVHKQVKRASAHFATKQLMQVRVVKLHTQTQHAKTVAAKHTARPLSIPRHITNNHTPKLIEQIKEQVKPSIHVVQKKTRHVQEELYPFDGVPQ